MDANLIIAVTTCSFVLVIFVETACDLELHLTCYLQASFDVHYDSMRLLKHQFKRMSQVLDISKYPRIWKFVLIKLRVIEFSGHFVRFGNPQTTVCT